MNAPHSIHRIAAPAERTTRGFALLIVITLVSFLVLVLVALATFTRVETSVASNAKQQEQARQNALMALNIALGQLQKYAGPDNITTARADILSSTPSNTANFSSYYTGVWGPTQPISNASANGINPRPASPLLTWLVSGNETSPLSRTPADAASADDILLVDNAVNQQPELRVRVRKQKIMSDSVPGLQGTSVSIGNYAYWVGDEGVKAKLNLTDPYAKWSATTAGNPAMAAHFPDPNTEALYRLSVAQRFGIEQIGTNLAGTDSLGSTYDIADGSNANFRRDLAKLNDFNQLKVLPGFQALNGSNDVEANRFHDITVASYGLLTNPDTGGLKEDLTWHFEHPSASPLTNAQIDVRYPNTPGAFNAKHSWKALRDYYVQADLPRPIEVQSPVDAPYITDSRSAEPITPAPVLTQFRVFFSPEASGNIRMRLAFVVANPYTEDLRLGDGLSFTFAFGLGISGSFRPSYLTVTSADTSGGALPGTPLNILDQLVSGGASATTTTSTSYIYAIPGPVTLKSGEAQVFTLANDVAFPLPTGSVITLKQGLDTSTGVSLARNWPTSYPDRVIFDNPLPSGATQPSRFGLKMWRGQAPGTGSIRPLQYISDQAWTATSGATGPQGGGVSISLIAPLDAVPNYNGFSQPYNFRNFRAPVIYSSNGNDLVGTITLSSFVSNDEFGDDLVGVIPWGSSNTLANGKTSVVTTAIPLRNANKEPAMMSLAEFRNVSLGTGSVNVAAAIGNSIWFNFGIPNINPGGVTDISFIYNEALWDRFYFSTIPQLAGDFTAGTDTLPNARLVVKSSTPSSKVSPGQLTADQYSASRYLMINGPFNVNSTSVQAWKAFLSGTKGLSLHDESGTNITFFRTIKQPGNSSDARNLDQDDAWNGYVSLTDDEISQLATRIVTEVKTRGPFDTLGEFVNRRLIENDTAGALQKAIDDAGINTIPSASTRQAFAGIPGYLTQGDILQAVGPALATRSDTFVIRAYGDSINPLDPTAQPTSRACCEAIVQRMQDPVENTSAPSGTTTPSDYITPPGDFGRRFVVVSFRWLSPDEI